MVNCACSLSLFLNVWTPAGARKSSKLPVMVWLYGGGFQQGASSHPEYDGKRLAEKGTLRCSCYTRSCVARTYVLVTYYTIQNSHVLAPARALCFPLSCRRFVWFSGRLSSVSPVATLLHATKLTLTRRDKAMFPWRYTDSMPPKPFKLYHALSGCQGQFRLLGRLWRKYMSRPRATCCAPP